jgi:transcription elongation factor GreB
MSRYRPPQPAGSRYITPEGAAALRAELDQLWRVRRPEVTAALTAAAAEGDRSENAEYIYRKKELREIDRRIRHLTKRLDGITVVDRLPDDTGQVRFGAWFDIVDDSDRLLTLRLVGPDETGMGQGYISVDSPLGRAIRGRTAGDTVNVSTPAGEKSYRVTAVRYAPAD